MNILGIESSCDDTGAAIVQAEKDGSFKVLSNIITTQDHTDYGGVVPEVAARHHATAIMPTIIQALEEAGMPIQEIDAIAVTRGPGLIGCLLVGVETAKTLATSKDIPIIGINHMEAHIASSFVDHPHVKLPAVALLVSGGNTMLVYISELGKYELMGQTRDDAVGEAFDKVARMLDLPYPGGPHISKVAQQGNAYAYDFPKPMLNSGNFDFSFAGIKTAIKYHIQDYQPLSKKEVADIAASFQESVVEVMVVKTVEAASSVKAKTVIIGGGVSANKELQARMQYAVKNALPTAQLIIPKSGLFTDNGAMIAIAAAPRALQGDFDNWQEIKVDPKLKISEITIK